MTVQYRIAASMAILALGAILLGIVAGPDSYAGWLVLAAAGGPAAVALAVAARLRAGRFPIAAAVGGATVGPLAALVAGAAAVGFVYAFVAGFADAAAAVLDNLEADPRLVTALASPWTLALLVHLAAIAPLAEEAGKAAGALFARPATRRDAFLSGVAAGAGFAVVENLLYVGVGAAFGGPWPEIALARMLGAAVHPLASGLVMLGVWDARAGRRRLGGLRGYLAGVAVHALWNGSLVAQSVVETAFDLGGVADSLTTAGFGYMIALGVVLAGGLWWVTQAVAADRDPIGAVDFTGARAVAGWTLLAASVLVPVTILVTAFPGFYLG